MKKVIQMFLSVVLGFGGFFSIQADTSVLPEASPGTVIPHEITIRRMPRKPNEPITDQPTALSSSIVHVWYDYEEMTITFKTDEGDCTVMVYDDEIGSSKKYRISTSVVSTIQTGDIRKGRIRMLTEAGNEYAGTVY